MRPFATSLLLFLTFIPALFAGKPVPNRPFLLSDPEGVFYARSVPAAERGNKGKTTLYKVGDTTDTKLGEFDWYAEGRFVIGWSPIAGKVVLMVGPMTDAATGEQSQLSFYVGDKLVQSYSAKDLEALGVDRLAVARGSNSLVTLGQCHQIPGTNEYVFSARAHDGTELRFDVLTGKRYDGAKAEGR